jgi:hypothetical protein
MSAFAARTMGAVLGLILGAAFLWVLKAAPAAPPSVSLIAPRTIIQSTSAASTITSDRRAEKTVLPGPEPIHVEPEKRRMPTSRPTLGTLSVNAVPGNVKIYIDGQLWKGSVPLEIQLPVGPHTVTIAELGAPPSAQIVRKIIIKANDHTAIVERM